MKLFIASDHAGFPLKEELRKRSFTALDGSAVTFEDLGTKTADSVDYPDYADLLVEKLLKEESALGVLICGSGVGISIAANRYKGIRAVLAESEKVAKLSREHNHANVLCMGSNIVSADLGAKILQTFLNATPDQGERHLRRINKLKTKGC